MSSPGGGDVSATGRLIVDASAVRSGVASAHSSLSTLYGVVRDNWWGLQAIGQSAGSVGAAVAAGFGTAVQAAADFQSGMAAVARTTQEQGESAQAAVANTKGLGDQLKALAETRPVSLKSLTDIAAQAGSLGIARKDVKDFTSTIADLITTTNLTEDSAATLAKTGNVFGLVGPQYKRLASAIYEAGVNTAATETEVVNMTNRLSPFAKQAGLSASQTVGLSAAVLSLGPRAEAGATALQRLFGQMADASTDKYGQEFGRLAQRVGMSTDAFHNMLVANNGNRKALDEIASAAGVSNKALLTVANGAAKEQDKLKAFSDIAGLLPAQFQNLVKTDPGTALSKFVEGLGKVSTNSVTAHRALADLGITEQREITTLEALASGTENGAKSSVNLATALGDAQKAYADGTVVQQAAAAQNATLNASMAETRNIVHNVAIQFGDELVPAVGLGNQVLRGIATGLESLPEPARAVIAGFAGVAGLSGSLASGLILVGSRLFLAQAAYAQMRSGLAQTMAVQRGKIAEDGNESASTLRVAFSTGLNYQAIQREIAVKAQEARMINLTADLRGAEVQMIMLQLRMREQLIALEEAENAGRITEVELLNAQILETEALLAAKGQEIVALEGEQLALAGVTETMGIATVAATGFGAATRFLLGPIGAILGIVGLVAGGIAIMGNNAEHAAAQTQELSAASNVYLSALQAQAQGQENAVKAAIVQQLAQKGLIDQGAALGVSTATLVDYVLHYGNAVDILGGALNNAQAQQGAFTAQQLQMIDVLGQMQDQYSSAAAVFRQQNAGDAALGITPETAAASASGTDDMTKSAADLDAELAKLTDGTISNTGATDANTAAKKENVVTQDQAYQAAASLAQDQLSIEQAQESLTNAVDAYNQALHDSHERNLVIRSDEADLRSKRAQQKLAVIAVADAERELKTARADAVRQLQEDKDAAADAEDAYIDAQQKLADAQQHLKDIRAGSPAQALAEAEAEHKLADARLKLRDDTITINDAEAQLNYLRAEGASKRDILDAERALANARAQQADDGDAAKEAQKALDDERAKSNPKAVAEAEREIAAAERALREALNRLHEANRQVSQDRKDLQDNKAYITAQQKLADAQKELADKTKAAKDASYALKVEMRDGGKEAENLKDAETAVKSAALQLAGAQVTLKNDMDTANGRYVSAKTNLDRLRGAMQDVSAKVNGTLRVAINKLGHDMHATSGLTDGLESNINGVGSRIRGLPNFKGVKVTVDIDDAVVASATIADLLGQLQNGKITQAQFDAAYRRAMHINTHGVGRAQGAIISQKTFLPNGDWMGEAGSEIIMPLHDLWGALQPLNKIASTNATTNSMLSHFMANSTGGGGDVNSQHVDNSTTHNNDIKVIANTPVDAQNIGRDIAWNMKVSL